MRGVVGTGITWALGWMGVGAVLHFVFRSFGYHGFIGISLYWDLVMNAAMGLVGGTVFASGLLLTEGRRGLDGIRVRRGAFWGVLAGLVGPIVYLSIGVGFPWLEIMRIWPLFLGTAVFGGGSGAAMTAIAKTANRRRLEAIQDAAMSLPGA